MALSAYIVHQSRGRTRIKIPDKTRDHAFFEQARERLSALDGIEEVTVRPLASSILLLHPEIPFSDIEGELGDLDLFELEEKPASSGPETLLFIPALEDFERSVVNASKEGHALLFLLLLGLAFRQMLRGQVMTPALPLLLHALELAQKDATTGTQNPSP